MYWFIQSLEKLHEMHASIMPILHVGKISVDSYTSHSYYEKS